MAFDKGPSGAPGIFFSYEFSPIMIKLTEKSRYILKCVYIYIIYTY